MADVFLDAHGISHGLTRDARLALERTLLAMAIDALSGPGGLAGFLRASLLGRPFSGASLPLDLGGTGHIPGYLRRALILRDRTCQWPAGCDRPASHCEPHHLHPRAHGGPTSLANLRLLCRTHHHHYVHRLGWNITAHPDGTLTATSPNGNTIHSHRPRDRQPPNGIPAAQDPAPRDPATRDHQAAPDRRATPARRKHRAVGQHRPAGWPSRATRKHPPPRSRDQHAWSRALACPDAGMAGSTRKLSAGDVPAGTRC